MPRHNGSKRRPTRGERRRSRAYKARRVKAGKRTNRRPTRDEGRVFLEGR